MKSSVKWAEAVNARLLAHGCLPLWCPRDNRLRFLFTPDAVPRALLDELRSDIHAFVTYLTAIGRS